MGSISILESYRRDMSFYLHFPLIAHGPEFANQKMVHTGGVLHYLRIMTVSFEPFAISSRLDRNLSLLILSENLSNFRGRQPLAVRTERA